MPSERGLILAIETSNPSAWQPGAPCKPGVAVGRRGEVLGRADIDPTATHDDALMVAVDAAMRAASATPRHLSRVAVSAGPGGYTAVRLAVTTAKLIAEATGAECVAVPTAHVVARRVDAAGQPFAVLLASKGQTAWCTVFAPGGPRAGALVGPADVAGLNVGLFIADRFLPPAIREAAAGARIIPPVFDAAACIEASFDFPAVDPIALTPIYPREPEAITKWRALHPG
ncbi:MAG: tRNA (adenosine(37)-N6)-threonylcarbamoyltransferase complex dimerization subunit type 1 TsaB [Planctomycetes bacterium]|nr:tRNA (adenosine(37)-N6)-threonylcarbamoyltransferase complex dimerization subunit type 1 TsaB [Planctomycetota bacterium]